MNPIRWVLSSNGTENHAKAGTLSINELQPSNKAHLGVLQLARRITSR